MTPFDVLYGWEASIAIFKNWTNAMIYTILTIDLLDQQYAIHGNRSLLSGGTAMRHINILSGLICTGKSAYLRKLMGRPEFRDATTVSLDDIGILYWGRRTMTGTEKIYRNQLAREEVQRRIIVDGAQTVLLEMVMLTRKKHQEPFVRMVADTEQYLRLIETERAKIGQRQFVQDDSNVRLNVVLLYCSLERVQERIERRKREGNSNSPVLSMDGVLHAAIQFEMPEVYDSLPLDTTDECEEAECNRMQEITAFFLREEKPTQAVFDTRMNEARKCLYELKQEAKKEGIVLI